MSAGQHWYGLPEDRQAEEDESSSSGSAALLLLPLVVALAAATVWFVALPAFNTPTAETRSCEVVLLESGAPSCVANPQRRSAATLGKHEPARS